MSFFSEGNIFSGKKDISESNWQIFMKISVVVYLYLFYVLT